MRHQEHCCFASCRKRTSIWLRVTGHLTPQSNRCISNSCLGVVAANLNKDRRVVLIAYIGHAYDNSCKKEDGSLIAMEAYTTVHKIENTSLFKLAG
jgi:hypothetical protein